MGEETSGQGEPKQAGSETTQTEGEPAQAGGLSPDGSASTTAPQQTLGDRKQASGEQKTEAPRPSFQDSKRLPAVDRAISGIRPEDIRVKVTGMVVDRQGRRLVIDDGTGKVEASFEEDIPAAGSDFVRVFGRVMAVDGGFELQGEIVQDMSGVDRELLRQTRELEKTFKTGK